MKKKQCACCGQATLELEDFDICDVCGWHDDPVQNDDPDYRGGANFASLNEAKKAIAEGKTVHDANAEARRQYKRQQKKRAKSPVLYDCPCCGNRTLHWHGDVCDTCYWEDDPAQNADPDNDTGKNDVSLNAARTAWAKGIDVADLSLDTYDKETVRLFRSNIAPEKMGTTQEALDALSDNEFMAFVNDAYIAILKSGKLGVQEAGK
jgi:hypothetical protein